MIFATVTAEVIAGKVTEMFEVTPMVPAGAVAMTFPAESRIAAEPVRTTESHVPTDHIESTEVEMVTVRVCPNARQGKSRRRLSSFLIAFFHEDQSEIIEFHPEAAPVCHPRLFCDILQPPMVFHQESPEILQVKLALGFAVGH